MRLTLLLAMWQKSLPSDYNSFRTFIFGITKQSMFPHGVVYEGVSEEPLSFRGESGANDSMVSRRMHVDEMTLHRYSACQLHGMMALEAYPAMV